MRQRSDKRSQDPEEVLEGEVVEGAPSTRKEKQSGGFRRSTVDSKNIRRAGVLLILLPAAISIAFVVALGVWVESTLPVLLDYAVPLLAGAAFITALLAEFEPSRRYVVPLIYMAPLLCGITAWILGVLVTLHYWGIWAVMLGLVFFGVGVIPLGLIAALLHADWQAALDLLMLLLLVYGFRQLKRQLVGTTPRSAIFHMRRPFS